MRPLTPHETRLLDLMTLAGMGCLLFGWCAISGRAVLGQPPDTTPVATRCVEIARSKFEPIAYDCSAVRPARNGSVF